jgi:hypothetical protein
VQRLLEMLGGENTTLADFLSQGSTWAASPLTTRGWDTHALLSNAAFTAYAALRLGLELPGQEGKKTFFCPKCHTEQTNTVGHALVCPGMQTDRTSRHKMVKEAMVEALRGLGGTEVRINPDREPPLDKAFTRKTTAGRGKRGDILVEFLGEAKRSVIVDVVVGAARPALCKDGAELDPRKRQGNVARALEKRKWEALEKTHQVPDHKRGRFVPFALEASGHVGEEAMALIQQIADVGSASAKDTRRTGEKGLVGQARERAISKACGRISAAVHRSNQFAVEGLVKAVKRGEGTPLRPRDKTQQDRAKGHKWE